MNKYRVTFKINDHLEFLAKDKEELESLLVEEARVFIEKLMYTRSKNRKRFGIALYWDDIRLVREIA